ncbi:MAG: phosphoribosylformylglycinamidine synthase subunit PurS [Acidimicrobiia bacterium]|nr:phosphoribosylformylglycinamidine synthase subunit PurS [Acidimicrobiia bacterium]
MRVRVDITRREGLSDPEGTTTRRALTELGFAVDDVHFGRSIYIDVNGTDEADVISQVEAMCAKLLANPVMEDFTIHVLD